MKNNKGFTLIELLVVIGILSILAVALLIAINPAEAQRKARDTQRLKDLTNIQAALEGWLNDNIGSSLTLNLNSSGSITTVRDCNSGWLTNSGTYKFCNYLNRLPVDPRNTQTIVSDGSGVGITSNAAYYVRAAGGVYNICTYLESKSNATKLGEDGYITGSGVNMFNVYSDTGVACP